MKPVAPTGPLAATTTARPAGDRPTTAVSEPAHTHHAMVIGVRMALVMLLVAGVAMLALGAATLLLVDPPETDGWLRSTFGSVFGSMAIGMSVVLGIPAAVGLWAMAGASAPAAVPALPRALRWAIAFIGAALALGAAVISLTLGNGISIVDLGLIWLTALLAAGLAGAATVSTHRARGALAAVALALVTLVMLRLLFGVLAMMPA